MTTADQPGTQLSGQELDRLDDAGLDRLLRPESGPLVFSRMDPSQKLRIVSRFKASGQVVAVTGDGVNDAAALKKADIGIAMGRGASDVAREAAAMVVPDGNFAHIVAAIEEGRAVYANIRRFVTYILTSNVPELVPFIVFVLLKFPLALTIMQILAVDLGTDLVPALGLGVEAPEPGLMDRPPRGPRDHLINIWLWLRAYVWLGGIEAGLSLLGFVLGCWSQGWSWGQPLPVAGPAYVYGTTMALAGIVACQVGNVFGCRTQWQSVFRVGLLTNRLVLGGLAAELALLVAIAYLPFLQGLYGTAPLAGRDWLCLVAFPLIILGLEELRKLILRRWRRPAGPAPAQSPR
jgi:magnesium-transporting ATPase (P-type)